MTDTITAPDGVREAAGQEEAELKAEADSLQAKKELVDRVHDTVVVLTTLSLRGEAVDHWEEVGTFGFGDDDGSPKWFVVEQFIQAARNALPVERGKYVRPLASAVGEVTGWGYKVGLLVVKQLVDIPLQDSDYDPIMAGAQPHDASIFRSQWAQFVDQANEMAVEQGWCGEYEDVIDSILSRLRTPGLTTPSRFIKTDVRITWTVTYSTVVEVQHAHGEDPVDAAYAHEHTDIENEFNIDVCYDDISTEVEVV